MTEPPWGENLNPKHASLARYMFERQVASYNADPEEANLAWMDDNIRDFWLREAWACLLFIAAFGEDD